MDGGAGDEQDGSWYYFDFDDQQQGPVSADAIWQLWSDGTVNDGTYAWCADAGSEWMTLGQLRAAAGQTDVQAATVV